MEFSHEHTVPNTLVNLRYDAYRDIYHAAPLPRRVINFEAIPGARLVGRYYGVGDKNFAFLDYQGSLWCWSEAEGKALIMSFSDHINSVVSLSGDSVAVLLRNSAPVKLSYENGTWQQVPLRFLDCPFMLTREDLGLESVDIPDITLSKPYTHRDAHFTDADARTIGKAYATAYRRLADCAAADHRYIQPVIARYRLRGKDGCILYTSAPVMISPEDGPQATSIDVSIPSSAADVITGLQLTAKSFGINMVRTSPVNSDWNSLVAGVELLISPQLHPFNPDAPMDWRYAGTASNTNHYTIYLPGFSDRIDCAAEGGRLRAQTFAVLAYTDTVMRPYDGLVNLCDKDISLLNRLMDSNITAPDEATAALNMLNPPHRMAANLAAVNGDTVIYGDLSSIPFEGYSFPEFVISTGVKGENTPTFTQVTMADNSTVVREATVQQRKAEIVSPLILYPSPNAKEIQFVSTTHRTTLKLAPTPCGQWSFYLNPGGKPLTLNGSALPYAVPNPLPRSTRWPNLVAAASLSDHQRLLSSTLCPTGELTVLIPAPRSGLAFQFAHGSFYAMGRDGIAGISPDRQLTTLTSGLLDSRGVSSAGQVVPIPGAVAALVGGELIRLLGSRVTTMLSPCPGSMLGYSPGHRELWCVESPSGSPGQLQQAPAVSAGGSVTVPVDPVSLAKPPLIVSLDGHPSYRRAGILPSSMLTTPDGLMIIDNSGYLYDAESEPDARTKVGWKGQMPCRSRGWTRAAISIPIHGEYVSGTVKISSHQGQPDLGTHLITSLTLSGTITHVPVPCVLSPHCHGLVVDVSAETLSPSKFSIS